MMHTVRVVRRYPATVLFSMVGCFATGLATYLLDPDRTSLFLMAWGVLLGTLAVVFRNAAVIKVEPHRIVSRVHPWGVTVPIHPGDRLAIELGRLFVVRHDGTWDEVRVPIRMRRWSDWEALQEAISRKWPPETLPR